MDLAYIFRTAGDSCPYLSPSAFSAPLRGKSSRLEHKKRRPEKGAYSLSAVSRIYSSAVIAATSAACC